MKHSKLFTSMALLLSLLFMDCSKSTDPAATAPASIEGTWLQTSIVTAECTDPLYNKAEAPCGTVTVGAGVNCDPVRKRLFTSTTMTESTTGFPGIAQPYALSGSTITITVSPTISRTYTYTLTTTKLTFSRIEDNDCACSVTCTSTTIWTKQP